MFKMRLILFCFLSLSNTCLSQHRFPPFLDIFYRLQVIEKDSLLQNYRIRVENIEKGISLRKVKEIQLKNERNAILNDSFYKKLKSWRLRHNRDSGYNDSTYLHVYLNRENPDVHKSFPLKGSIICLFMKNKKTNAEMNIYIRICDDLKFGDEITISRLEFVEGNYFYDMCASIGPYKTELSHSLCFDEPKPFFLLINYLEITDYSKHKITLRELRRIRRRNKCAV